VKRGKKSTLPGFISLAPTAPAGASGRFAVATSLAGMGGVLIGTVMLNESSRLSTCMCRALLCCSLTPSVKLTPSSGAGAPSICAAKLSQPARSGVTKLLSEGAVQMLPTGAFNPHVVFTICG